MLYLCTLIKQLKTYNMNKEKVLQILKAHGITYNMDKDGLLYSLGELIPCTTIKALKLWLGY